MGWAAMAVPSARANRPPEAPSGLLMNLMPEPLALESDTPLLSWIVRDPDPSEIQTAYQVRVAETPDRLARGVGLVWDSGKVVSAESSAVPYAGPPLEADRIYYWTVRTWDARDAAGPYAEPTRFATGLRGRWAATPIWGGGAAGGAEGAWTAYTVEARFSILERAVGFWLRAADADNHYLWQIVYPDGAAHPILRTHVFRNGAHQVLKQVDLREAMPGPASAETVHRAKFVLQGDEIRTWINEVLVDTTRDTAYASGRVGFRAGQNERAAIHDIAVRAADGKVLWADDFAGRPNGVFLVDRGGRYLHGQPARPPDFVFLRRAFHLRDQPVQSAIVHVTALSPETASQYVYKLYVNGVFAGAGPERGFNGDERYNSFDVAPLLRPGAENVLAALNFTRQDRRFMLRMTVRYADGTSETLVSDRAWKALDGDEIIRDQGNAGHDAYYYLPREGLDARRYPFGWTAAGFDDRAWSAAREKAPMPPLKASVTCNTERHLVSPARVMEKGPGVFFIDFGRAVVGGLRLELKGEAGRAIEIRQGEELSGPDTVRHAMRTGNTYQETWTLADGPQTLEQFGYRVFRYAEVRNAPAGFGHDAIRAEVLRHPFDENAARFESSDEVLNDVWAFCKYTIQATSLDVYVDTHTRERRNYEGDALINQLSHYAVDREFALPRYSIEYLYYRPTWPTEYKLQSVMMAWYDYLHTGQSDSLRRHYAALKTKTLEEFVADEGLVRKPPDAGGRYGRDLVDWPDSQRDSYRFTPVNTVINAFHYKAISDLASIAGVLGEEEDARRYAELARRQHRAINEHLFDPATGRFRDGQGVDHHALHANAFPLAVGVVEPGAVESVADYAASRGMAVSVYGSQFLLEGLYAAHRAEAALKLMNARTGNSWGHMLYTLGATIVGEAWDPAQKPNMSFSHAWASAPANMIPRGLFGVIPLEPAFRRFQIKPQPADLAWATLTVPTIRGTIALDVRQPEGGFVLRAEIPANTRATVWIPLGATDGTSVVRWNGQPAQGRVERGFFVIDDVGSGRHTFTRAAPAR
jgi:alpha-L-rhamnosidase